MTLALIAEPLEGNTIPRLESPGAQSTRSTEALARRAGARCKRRCSER
jgi:hypothetical protein